jgi:hypothetical protein
LKLVRSKVVVIGFLPFVSCREGEGSDVGVGDAGMGWVVPAESDEHVGFLHEFTEHCQREQEER